MRELEPPRPSGGAPDDPPPLLGSWPALYWLVIGELAVLVVLFSTLTWWAS